MSGVNTTLILHPATEGLSDITFDQSGATGATSGYIVPAGSIRLHEEKRLEIAYAQSPRRDGGEVSGAHGPLVPLEFDVLISGTSRADMLEKADALYSAVTCPDGGTLEFKPDGVGASVMSTFYHYLQSPPPALVQSRDNRWDNPAKADSRYRILAQVTLMTLPFATSDPDSPVIVINGATVYNVGDGSQDYATATASVVKGGLPALVRLSVTPGGTGDAAVGRLLLANRTRGLTNFDATYLSSSAIAPTGVWSNQVDASRCGGSYERCTPTANGEVYGRRFTISNWSDHKGRVAIAVIVRSNGTAKREFDIYYAWTIGNTVVYGEAKNVSQVQQWEVLLLGEPDIPETELSDIDDLDLYIDIYVKRTSGTGTFDIDGLKLFYTDEGALQVDMPAGVGASSSYKFILENLEHRDIAHVLTTAANKLSYLPTVYGSFLTFDPNRSNRVDLAWHRYKAAVIVDDFSGYGDYWQQIATFEDSEGWTGGVAYTPAFAEGDRAMEITLTGGAGTLEWTHNLNLETWESGDFICLWVFVYYTSAPSAISLTLTFSSQAGARYQITKSLNISPGAQSVLMKRGDFTQAGYPSWASITHTKIEVTVTGGTGVTIAVDDLRAVKVDPNDATKCNDTYGEWEIPGDEVHIYVDDNDLPYALGGAEWDNAFHEDIVGTDFTLSAKCKMYLALQAVGLWFRVSDTTTGSEDGYLFLHYADYAYLYEYTGGDFTNLQSKRIADLVDEVFYLGVLAKGDSIKCFISTDKDTLFQAQNVVLDVTDSTHSGTRFGVNVDYGARLTDVRFEEIKDLHVPADSLTLTGQALFQTIVPFHEASS